MLVQQVDAIELALRTRRHCDSPRLDVQLIDEKAALLGELCERGAWLFYTHDPEVAMSRLQRVPDKAGDAEGRLVPVEPVAALVRRVL